MTRRIVIHNHLPKKRTRDASAVVLDFESAMDRADAVELAKLAGARFAPNTGSVQKFSKESGLGMASFLSLLRSKGIRFEIKARSGDKARDEEFKPGDRIHLGFGAKGGAGFYGVVTKVDGDSVEIKNENGKTYTGPVRYASKDKARDASREELERKLKRLRATHQRQTAEGNVKEAARTEQEMLQVESELERAGDAAETQDDPWLGSRALSYE